MTDPPRGFPSVESRSRVKRAVIRVGVAGILLQLIAPVALMFASMPGLDPLAVRAIDPDRGAWWKGALWLIETEIGILDPGARRAGLLRWDGSPEGALQPMASFDGADPWLLPATDRLWIVSASAVGWLGAGGLELTRVAPVSPEVSRPFLWRGRPTLVAETASGRFLYSFSEGRWLVGEPFDLGGLDAGIGAGDIEVAIGEGGLEPWVAIGTQDGLRVAPGLPPCPRAEECPAAFETAVESGDLGSFWTLALANDGPLVVTARNEGGGAQVTGYRRGASGWGADFRVEAGIVNRVGVFPDDRDPDRLLVACQGFPGSLAVWTVKDGAVLGPTRLGETPLEAGWLSGWQLANYALSLLIPILAILLLAPVLARHKTPVVPLDDGVTTLPAAPLLRRGLAKAVDGAIALLPLIPAAALLLGSAFDVERTIGESLGDLGTWLGVAVGWSAICLLLFSVLESRTGRTPGKRLLGLRVVAVSGAPVSLGRALLRNLVLLADGAFGFLVGIALVALTPRWQRLGDLAAKTLVVRG